MKIPVRVVIISLCLSACSTNSIDQINDFGKASAAAGQSVNDIVGYMSSSSSEIVVRSESDSIVNSKGLKKIDYSSLEQMRLEINANNNMTKVTLISASKALTEYANTLSLLVTAGDESKINSSLVTMGKSVESIKKDYTTFRKDNSSGSSLENNTNIENSLSLIASLSSSIVDAKRKEKIKEIIIGANASVTYLCDVIYEQLGRPEISRNYQSLSGWHVSTGIMDFNANSKNLSYEEGYEKVQGLMKDYMLYKKSMEPIYESRSSILSVKIAHQKLYELVKNDKYSSSDLLNAIKDIEKHVDNFNDMKASFSK